MNNFQRQSFKKALEYSHTTLELSKKLRESPYPNKDSMLKDFSITWSIYEDLFAIMRTLLSSSKGELKKFYTGCYESYLNDYKLLKSDMGDLLSKNKAVKPLISGETAFKNGGKKEKVFTDFLKKITSFEIEKMQYLKSSKPERISLYFGTLNKLYTDLFSFIKNVFDVAEKTQNFSFFISDNIKMSWQVATVIDKNDITGWNNIREEEEKIAVEIGNIYYKLASTSDSYPGSSGNLIQSFTQCIQRLSKYSKTQNLQEFYQKNIEFISDMLEEKEEEGVIGFLTKLVKSGNSVDYRVLDKNKYLLTLRNLIHSTLTSLELLMKFNDQISQCYYEMSFFYQFLKRYVVKIVMVEFYKRLIIFDRVKRNLILE